MLSSELPLTSNFGSFPFEVCNLLLGKGGSGQVFLGRVSNSERYVAIKKRYGKLDRAADKARAISSKDTAAPEESSPSVTRGPHSPFFYSAVGRGAFPGETSSMFPTEYGDGCALSQRRELDLGEESVTQVAAFSQQGSKQLLDLHNEDAVAEPFKSSLLLDEVSIMEHLGPHPQLVRLMGSHTTSRSVSFFAMELMDSDVARELKEQNSSFRNENVCLMTVFSVLKALAYMHERGVVHRDVKPGNILLKRLSNAEDWPCVNSPLSPNSVGSALPAADNSLASQGNAPSFVKAALGDFSAAHGVASISDVTFSDTRGTLHYKAPEQLLGRRGSVSENVTAVDMWGLGCTVFEMVTGHRPFPGSSELQVLMSILDLMGSDIQSFPSSRKPPSLFAALHVSEPFSDLLQRLLSLDASQRPSAKEALQHPVFDALRKAEECAGKLQSAAIEEAHPHILGIPLVLKYTPFAMVPQLRFSRISRTPPKISSTNPEQSVEAAATLFNASAAQTNSQNQATACPPFNQHTQTDLPHAQNTFHDAHGALNTDKLLHLNEEATEALRAADAEGAQHRSPDTTAMSFMSESSYLHWSEIRPMEQQVPHLPLSQQHPQNADQSTSGRGAGSFGANSGGTPSSSMCCRPPHRLQFSETSLRPSALLHRNTVARALNISDSSVKVARTERSASHCDFDLSPVAATQLFGADADFSSCIVPHAGFPAIPRPSVPVLQLKSGSTFTASNLRANSSFERDGACAFAGAVTATSATAVPPRTTAALAMSSGSFSTPRESALLQTTAYAGRALCFSEETDRIARRSNGSCVSQPSCLNSLLTSPAPRSRVHEGSSPHPSPIRPVGIAARSPSGVPLVERSGLSSDDSCVGLRWATLGLDTAAASSTTASTGVCAATAEPRLPQPKNAAPLLSAAHVEPPPNCCGCVAGVSTSPITDSPQVRRRVLCAAARDSTKALLVVPPSSTIAGTLAQNGCGGETATAAAPVLPLPIPLSVASGKRTPSSSRALSTASPSASPVSTSTHARLQEAPQTQHGCRVTSASRAAMPTRRSRSSIVTVRSSPSPSPEYDGRDRSGGVRVLQQRDTNVLSPHPQQKRKGFAECATTHHFRSSGGLTPSAGPSALRERVNVPVDHAVAMPRSQRHCTPSSAEPSREPPAMRVGSHEARQLSLTRLSSSVLCAEVPALHMRGPGGGFVHTPAASMASRSLRVTTGSTPVGRYRVDCDVGCSASPRSTERRLYKRSREEATNEKGTPTAEERRLEM